MRTAKQKQCIERKYIEGCQGMTLFFYLKKAHQLDMFVF